MSVRLLFFLVALLFPIWAVAQQNPPSPPTDQQLLEARLKSAIAELEYAKLIIVKIQLEWKISEDRAKWAVDKLWELDQ